LLPPELRDGVPPDHLVHFIMAAVGLLDLSAARINHRGSGSEQYPPSLMPALLISSHARGTFSSRRHLDRIERTVASKASHLVRRGIFRSSTTR